MSVMLKSSAIRTFDVLTGFDYEQYNELISIYKAKIEEMLR